MILHLALAAFLAVLSKTDPRLEATARDIVTHLIAGDFAAVTQPFNDDFRKIATPELLAGVRNDLAAQAGAYRGVKSVRQLLENARPVVELTVDFEKSAVIFRVSFDEGGRVSSVVANPYVAPKIDPALTAAAVEIFRAFTTDRYDVFSRRFDATMRKQLTLGRFQQVRTSIETQFGSVGAVKNVEQTIDGDYRIVSIIAQYEVMPVEMRVTFNRQGEVAGVWVAPKRK